MIIGPYINALAIISGAVIGAVLGGRIPERLRTNLTLIFGLCSMGMGILDGDENHQYAGNDFIAVIRHDNRGIALLEHGINKLASSAKGLVERCFQINQVP